jgi:hypothetical protein
MSYGLQRKRYTSRWKVSPMPDIRYSLLLATLPGGTYWLLGLLLI